MRRHIVGNTLKKSQQYSSAAKVSLFWKINIDILLLREKKSQQIFGLGFLYSVSTFDESGLF